MSNQEEPIDLLKAVRAGTLRWDSVVELGDIVARDSKTNDWMRSLFVSLGVAIEDIAIARTLVDKAQQTGMGQRLA